MEGNTRIGQRIGNYRITERVSSGSFGSVYKAEHIHLKGRVVAIKLLHTHLEGPSEQRQFTQEAQFLAQLEHPYILPLIDFGFSEHQPYLITRYAPGGSLRHLLRQQKQHLPFARTLSLLQQVGKALQFAHDQQIIHRDLKPENILFNEREEALLADFGIAIMLSTTNSKHVTAISGTPFYMAPEQFQGIISKQSDQYALGCIAYELFTGRVPFTAPDFFALGFQHLTATPVPLHEYNKQIPLAAETAILKALAKQRTDRYPTITTFLAALAEPFVQSTIQSPLAPPFSLAPTIEVSNNPVQQKSPEKKSEQQWVDEGNIFLAKERYEEALAAFEQALALDPTFARAYYHKGVALENLQRGEEALVAYEQALVLDPTSFTAYYNKGFALAKLERNEEALAAFEQALALDPTSVKAYHTKGFALAKLERNEEALAAFEQALALDPTDALAYFQKGFALAKLERNEEALVAYEQALVLDPTFAWAYNNKGVALENLQRYEEALAAFEQALALDPTSATAYSNKGDALRNLQRYEEALAAFEQAIVLDSTSAEAYTNKGHALGGLQRYEEAIAAFEQALALDPTSATAYNNKGIALHALGRHAEARQWGSV